jgi:hypothetical protein
LLSSQRGVFRAKKRARLNASRYFLASFDYPEKRTDLLRWD